jgi:hypothetical protein
MSARKCRRALGHCVILTFGMTLSPDPPTQPAEYYRRKAAEARRVAEGVTTAPIRTRLLDMAREFDRLARATASATEPPNPES